ncbi:MAG: hypothetical protein SFY66_05800 [Oculatellaceae cyanobacterium bins.114]|nr:hypothetical protein [Oculatellaceae cyanobacterium bins.114]
MRADAYLLGSQHTDSNSTLSAQKPFVKSGLAASVSQTVSNFVAHLSGTSEPQIWQTQDQAGDILWNVYDPSTHQTSVFHSETEVRVWIDERYNY